MAMFGDSGKEFSSSDFPAPRIVAPESVPSLRWGILGAGEIADIFAETAKINTQQKILAVASLTPGKAEKFAARWDIPHHYWSYQALVQRDDIDAVYIANLPHQHLEAALLSIDAGKAVLIEKPTTITANDAEIIYSRARERGVLAMEAMWTRYLPHADVVRQLVEERALGELNLFQADFGQDNRSVERLWLPEASILQDMGIYPLSFAQMIFGNPVKISATGSMANATNEAMAVAHLKYASGANSVITVSAHTFLPTRASLSGSEGLLEIDDPFFIPTSLALSSAMFNPPKVGWRDSTGIHGHLGLCHQLNHFAKYFSEGLLESPLQSHADTIAVLSQCQEIKRQIIDSCERDEA